MASHPQSKVGVECGGWGVGTVCIPFILEEGKGGVGQLTVGGQGGGVGQLAVSGEGGVRRTTS